MPGGVRVSLVAGIAFRLRCRTQARHSRPVNEDEAKTVAAVAAQCLTWGGWRRWGLIMRYGRLFKPGTDVGGGVYPMLPDWAGRNAYRRATGSGQLYAEGYACRPIGLHVPVHWAWCLDGETVADPGFSERGNAYFGVALRPGYVRRVHEAQRNDDGSDGFMWAFTRHEQENPPLDPASDIVLDLGRDIPSSVRDWALTSERHPGGARQPPAWVLDELLRFGGHRPPDPPHPYLQFLGLSGEPEQLQAGMRLLGLPAGQRVPDTGAGPQGGRDMRQSQAPLPVSYSWYLVRHADWFDSGMALQCGGRAGGVFTDDGDILGKIRDGDGLDTLIRWADEHRARCEWAVSPGDEPEYPELTVQEGAEVRLEWVAGAREGRSFAVLHRLDYNVWDAWLHPAHLEGQTAGEEPAVRLTRNGVSYEMALLAVSRAMGDAMPEEFAVAYLGDHPETGPHPQPVEVPAGERARSASLPMSYARYLIRGDGLGLALHCSGRTGGVSSDNGTELNRLQDGDSLDTLIRWADEHRARCEWAVCPADEREHPELTAQKRAEVYLKGTWDWQASRSFAKLHRLDHNVWDAWLHPAHLEGRTVREEPPVRLTPNGVSYEMALTAVFRAMGDEMPEKLAVVYLYDWPQRDPLGA